MNAGWENRCLSDCCENLDSQRKPITKSKRRAGKIPYYGASGIVDYVDGFLFDEDLLLISEDGANLLARTYPIAFSISGKTWVNNHAHVLRFPDRISQRLVEFYLNSISLRPWVSGMAQPKLNQTKLNSIPIPFPPLAEQTRIVAILDEAFGAIAKAKENAERNLANAKELFESYLNKVFTEKGEGWEERRVEEIAEVKSGKRVPKGYKFEDATTNFPYIRISDFTNEGTVRTNKLKYLSEKVFEGISRYIITDADVYITIVGATVGKAGIIPPCLNGANLTENACRLVLNAEIEKRFVYFFTQTNSFKEQVGINTRVAAQPKLALRRLKSILIPFPQLEEQRDVVRRCDQLRGNTKEIESIFQQKLSDLDELKQSILQKAFTGRLTSKSTELQSI
ncbi:MAG: restriction endonuclease subunit S [Planctomycetaceae bacterium]|jgi:type I restriction enzyme, S subunit|nr:restriction endonuclease subunit S [Planctomycetaceae bacterium]